MKSSGPKRAYEYLNIHGLKYEKRIFSLLSDVYPGIATVKEFEGLLYVVYENSRVPFFVMGEGFQAAFIYLCSLLATENSVILCEEPENYQHPASRHLIVKGMCESATKNQLFVTSHSLELLDELILEAEKAKIDVRFFVTSRKFETGELHSRSFDLEKAIELRELVRMDLRG